MQFPPHSTCTTEHETWQLLLLQTWPEGQTSPGVPGLLPTKQSPEAPQYPRSLVGLTQMPPQLTCEPGQDTAHTPLLQTWPAAQTVPSLAPVQSPEAPQ